MSRYLVEFLGLMLLPVALAYWKRHAGARHPPTQDGFYVVRWPLTVRLVNVVFFIVMLATCIFFLWSRFASDQNVPPLLWGLLFILLALATLGARTWRVRNEYNETTIIAYAMTGKPRQFALSDFTRAGPVSWRGHEFSTETDDKIYVNSYQTGAPALIELLQRQVKETNLE
jgi:hypothetical protein